MGIQALKYGRHGLGAIALLLLGQSSINGVIAQEIQRPAVTIFESVTLAPGFDRDPLTLRGISGGPLLAPDLAERSDTPTGPCVGFVDEEPDHTMVLDDFFDYLSLQIQSTEDTTLVVRGPGGTWCNDDYTNMNPGIAGQWLSGTYQIWVGSYQEDQYYPYVIRISETP
jgi:hypothetical protein